MINKTKLKIGVVRGGPGNENEVSMLSGESVLFNFPKDEYEARDIVISRDGSWRIEGKSRPPEDIVKSIDAVFIALHGEYGEDGKIQKFLDGMEIPYTGSGALASKIGMDKSLAKERFREVGLKTPLSALVGRQEDIKYRAGEIFRSLPAPYVVKPNNSGSSVGVSMAEDFASLCEGLRRALRISPTAIVEERIEGREATCGVMDNFRGKETYTFPPVEIVPAIGRPFFDYEAKYGGESLELCPGRFGRETSREIQEMAGAAHSILGLRHYSRTDFIISQRRGTYILEVNSLPGLTEESLFPKSLTAVGSSLKEFISHVIGLALR